MNKDKLLEDLKRDEGYVPYAYQAAVNNNLKRYFSGSPCPKGHIDYRFTSTRGCVVCAKENTEKWSKLNKEKCTARRRRWFLKNSDRQTDSSLKRMYGIDLNRYNELHNNQNGVCAICMHTEKIKNRRLSVDHCHETGKVRGLLCGRCNQAIGAFGDNIKIIQNAINYIERHHE